MNTFLSIQRRLLFGGIIALGILPLVLLTYGICMKRFAIVQDSDVNHASSLRYRSLWIYGATQTATAEKWQPELIRMQVLRADLAERYPEAVHQTQLEWNAFSLSLRTTGRVDWVTANRMSEAADTLTTAVQREANQRHIQSEWLFDLGIGIMMFSIGAGVWLMRLRSRQGLSQRATEEKLEQTELRLREMIENLPAGAIFVDDEEMITGYAREGLPTLDVWFQTIYQERVAEVQAFYEGYKANNLPDAAVVPILHKDGSVRQVEFAAVGSDGGEVWLMHDITHHQAVEEHLRLSQERLNDAQALAHIGSWELSLASGEGSWSEEMFRLHGLPQTPHPPDFDKYLGCVHPEDRDKVAAHARTYSEESIEYRLIAPDGKVRSVHAVVEVSHRANNVPKQMRGTLLDITERKRAQEQIEAANAWLAEANQNLEAQKQALEEANGKLKTLATTDGLTRIANHRAFQDALADEWQRGQRYSHPFSVILMDVDKFKQFNDSFGHPAGDTVLKTVAQLLNDTARETDFVARYGGEEFVVLLSETDSQGAYEAAERFRLAIEQYQWTLRPVTASFGVATLTSSMLSAQELIDGADKALYASKQNGRNRVTRFAASNVPQSLASVAS